MSSFTSSSSLDLSLPEEVRDELEAVLSVYEDKININVSKQSCLCHIKYNSSAFVSSIILPHGYPDADPEVVIDLKISSGRNRALREEVLREIETVIAANTGICRLFLIIECTRKFEECNEKPHNQEPIEDSAAFGEDISTEPPPSYSSFEKSTECGIDIFHGEPYTEKKSVFLAHFARVSSMEEVEYFRRQVLSDSKVNRATHNILAYRFNGPGGVMFSDHDDDGETAAGGRLSEILRLMGADGVAVIVTRWFGGTLLGADRFKIINNTARQLLEKYGVVPTTSKRASSGRLL